MVVISLNPGEEGIVGLVQGTETAVIIMISPRQVDSLSQRSFLFCSEGPLSKPIVLYPVTGESRGKKMYFIL
jgi:hypothetical protein